MSDQIKQAPACRICERCNGHEMITCAQSNQQCAYKSTAPFHVPKGPSFASLLHHTHNDEILLSVALVLLCGGAYLLFSLITNFWLWLTIVLGASLMLGLRARHHFSSSIFSYTDAQRDTWLQAAIWPYTRRSPIYMLYSAREVAPLQITSLPDQQPMCVQRSIFCTAVQQMQVSWMVVHVLLDLVARGQLQLVTRHIFTAYGVEEWQPSTPIYELILTGDIAALEKGSLERCLLEQHVKGIPRHRALQNPISLAGMITALYPELVDDPEGYLRALFPQSAVPPAQEQINELQELLMQRTQAIKLQYPGLLEEWNKTITDAIKSRRTPSDQ